MSTLPPSITSGSQPVAAAALPPERPGLTNLLGLVSWGLFAIAVPPLGLRPLALIGLVPWLVLVVRGWRRRLFASFLIGEAIYGAHHLFWVNEVPGWAGSVAWLVISALYVLFAIPLGLLLDQAAKPGRSIFWRWPALFVAHDLLRQEIIGGITWHSAGYALAPWTTLIQVADLGRVWPLTFLVYAANIAVAEFVAARFFASGSMKTALRHLAVVVILVVGFLVYGKIRMSEVDAATTAGPLLVGLQSNIGQDEKLRRDPGETERHFQRYMTLLSEASEQRPDIELVVWPETSYYPSLDDSTQPKRKGWPGTALFSARRPYGETSAGKAFDLAMKSVTASGFAPRHLIGIVTRDDMPAGEYDEEGKGIRTRNSALLVERQGPADWVIKDRYDKRALVPGGEYLPLRGMIPERDRLKERIFALVGFIPCMTRGTGNGVMAFPGRQGPVRFGVNICFEIVYPDYFDRVVDEGGQFVVNISNDAWFGTSAELDLVHDHAAFRTVESRRSLFRVSTSGISTLIDPCGREVAVVEDGGRRKGVGGYLAARVPVFEGGRSVVRSMVTGWTGIGVGIVATVVAAFVSRRPGGRRDPE